jgi:hypothetical protein
VPADFAEGTAKVHVTLEYQKCAPFFPCMQPLVAPQALEIAYVWAATLSISTRLYYPALPMIRSFLVCFSLLCGGALLAYGASVTLFQADYDGTDVRVAWEVPNESGVQEYQVFRKANNEPSFSMLASVNPNAQHHYEYIDQNSYHGLSGAPFTYRLAVRSAAGHEHFHTVLNETPSVMQRSWGTIKSMFR